MALPTLDATFASSADLPRKQMLAKWLVEELGETGGNSSVLISGAGSSEVNGTYTYRGDYNGKGYYNLVGEANSTTENAIIWEDDRWKILDSNTDEFYSGSDTEFPWTASWFESNGNLPVPTVTEIPPQSPTIADYYSLPERYLWAKIAVAAGGPKTEADYISLPTRYVLSDIYNAVAGLIPPSSVLVSGAGSSGVNGLYTYRGEANGKPYYNLVGYETNQNFWSIAFDGGSFIIISDEDPLYNAFEQNVAYPWLGTWTASNGLEPAPTVTEIPQPSPNHTDWSENVALGHIAAAYRGDTGNPANLATYIDWPWRYKVASIIQAL